MADLGRALLEINALPADQRKTWTSILTDILKNMRFGHPKGDQPDPCVNLGAGFFHGTTPNTPGDEFTIAHGFGRVPYLAMPVLRLDAVGSRTVPLTVTRAADDKRLYLSSTIANAPVCLVVEG